MEPEIIASLIDFARHDDLRLGAVDVSAVVHSSLTQLRVPERILVVTGLDHATRVVADAGQLERVFVNLIRNAIQAMPEGGRLEVTSQVLNPENAEVSFIDTGDGLSDEAREKVFEPFFSTKPGGLGLGLALSASLLQRQHGELEVTSELGKGSCFTVRLPLYRD